MSKSRKSFNATVGKSDKQDKQFINRRIRKINKQLLDDYLNGEELEEVNGPLTYRKGGKDWGDISKYCKRLRK